MTTVTACRKFFPDKCSIPPIVEEWEVEIALPKVLEVFYGDSDRFTQEILGVSTVVGPEFQELKVYVHVYYSFSDIVSFFSRDLGKFIADKLVPGKRLRLKDFWLDLPLLIFDHGLGARFRVKLHIEDWFGVEYSSLFET